MTAKLDAALRNYQIAFQAKLNNHTNATKSFTKITDDVTQLIAPAVVPRTYKNTKSLIFRLSIGITTTLVLFVIFKLW